MATITVKAKGNFGFHPGLRTEIRKGQEYTMDESEFGEELFERPAGWIPPWERDTKPDSATEEQEKSKTKRGDK